MPPSSQEARPSKGPTLPPPPSLQHQVAQWIQSFLTVSSKYELAAKLLTVLMAFCSVAILVLVVVEIGTLVSQRIGATLQTNQHRVIQTLHSTLTTLDKLDMTVSPADGVTAVSEDQVLHHRLSLAPLYPNEKQVFGTYIQALKDHRYKVLAGRTESLWTKTEDAKSAIGGINYAPDWWDITQSTVDIRGNILFTGQNVDKAFLRQNYTTFLQALGLSTVNPILTSSHIDAVLPRGAIVKKTQLGSLLYKLYSTDPQKLVSFNLRIATDAWIQGVSGNELKAANSTCKVVETPTFGIFEGYWCPRTFYPSASYIGRFENATNNSAWYIECDTPHVSFQLENVRWHAQMRDRYSTAFYHHTVRLDGPRKVVYSQHDLINIATWQNNASIPIKNIVGVPYQGAFEPLESEIFVVETDMVPDRIRDGLLWLTLLCLVYTRCSVVGIRTLFHFILESPLSILMDVAYAILTYSSGTELCSIVASVPVTTNRLKKFIFMAVALRPYNTPALLMTKALLSVRYGFRQISYCITIKESVVLILIQVLLLTQTSNRVMAVGMKAAVTGEDMSRFVLEFHGSMLAITVAFILVRFILGKVLDRYLKDRMNAAVYDRVTADTNTAIKTTKQVARTSRLPAYDAYLGGKFFAFGVSILPLDRVNGHHCRVMDGAALWLDVIFNFNMNGVVQYHQVLHSGFMARVSSIGQYTVSDTTLAEQQKQSGHVYLG